MLRETTTENGRVAGIPAADPRITVYKGIPFAKPPVGDLRWRAPQPADNWDGILKADTFAPIAMQEVPGSGDPEALYNKEWHVDSNVPMSEDCLYLNIWTPAKGGNEKLPVMFWIFGGGLQCGYPSEMEFDGERIARRGVVLVSVNYRVNIFGFFAHTELTKANPDEVPTNFGLLDQRAGMEWVKRNIASFGGDPDNVTIFGQSAGAGSVYMHLTSPMSEGLFNKAIMQSGGGLLAPGNEGFSLSDAEQKGVDFLKSIGVASLADARKIDAKKLYQLSNSFAPWSAVTDGRFMTETPTETFVKKEHKQIPIMIGNTADEFEVSPECSSESELEAYLEERYGDKKDVFLSIAKAVGQDIRQQIAAIAFNRFEIGNTLMCQVNAEAEGSPIYNYYFDPEIPGDKAGAFHSSELWFTFETLAKCWRPFVGKHYDLARHMCNYWTNFAKTGDPNGLDSDGSTLAEWKPYTTGDPCRMRFADKCQLENSFDSKLAVELVDFYKDVVKDPERLKSLRLPMTLNMNFEED